MSDHETLFAAALAAVPLQARRCADLLRSGVSPSARIPGSAWSVADGAAHLVLAQQALGEVAAGAPFPTDVTDRESFAEFNARGIDQLDETDPGRLAALLVDTGDRFAELAGKRSADDVVDFQGHRPLPAWALAGVLLGEQVLHSYDIAAGCGAPWPLDGAVAALALAAYAPLLPGMVDPDAVRGLTAAVDVQLRGGGGFRASFADGVLTLAAADGAPPHAVLTADPAALLLAASGRMPMHIAIATGLADASGPDPALALRLPALFRYL